MNKKLMIVFGVLIILIGIVFIITNKVFYKKNQETYKTELIKTLNEAFADEWLAYYQYWIGAKVVKGQLKKEIVEELIEHANEELKHADMIAKKIVELDSTPILEPKNWYKKTTCGYIKPITFTSKEILKQNLEAEICAIKVYSDILNFIDKNDKKTIEMIQEILDDEIEHKKDLTELLNKLEKQSD